MVVAGWRAAASSVSGTALVELSHVAALTLKPAMRSREAHDMSEWQQVLGHSCVRCWLYLVNPRPELEGIGCSLYPGQAWPYSLAAQVCLFSSWTVGKEDPMLRP